MKTNYKLYNEKNKDKIIIIIIIIIINYLMFPFCFFCFLLFLFPRTACSWVSKAALRRGPATGESARSDEQRGAIVGESSKQLDQQVEVQQIGSGSTARRRARIWNSNSLKARQKRRRNQSKLQGNWGLKRRRTAGQPLGKAWDRRGAGDELQIWFGLGSDGAQRRSARLADGRRRVVEAAGVTARGR